MMLMIYNDDDVVVDDDWTTRAIDVNEVSKNLLSVSAFFDLLGLWRVADRIHWLGNIPL